MIKTREKVGVVIYDPHHQRFFSGSEKFTKVFSSESNAKQAVRYYIKVNSLAIPVNEWVEQLVLVPVFAKVPNARQSD